MSRTQIDYYKEDDFSRRPLYYPGDVIMIGEKRYTVLSMTYSINRCDWLYRVCPTGDGRGKNERTIWGRDI